MIVQSYYYGTKKLSTDHLCPSFPIAISQPLIQQSPSHSLERLVYTDHTFNLGILPSRLMWWDLGAINSMM